MWKEANDGLYKKFELNNFSEAVEFINKVLRLSEEHNHHPRLINTYKTVEIYLKTHTNDSVTQKDKDLASHIDNIFSQKQIKIEEINSAELFTDGGSRGNPGPSAIGVAIINDNKIIYELGEYIGETTNNQAEYLALKKGLIQAIEMNIQTLAVFMDSELIIKQINGQYKVKNADLLPIYQEVKKLSANFHSISFTHVRREKNKIADGLVNKALDARIS